MKYESPDGVEFNVDDELTRDWLDRLNLLKYFECMSVV